MIIYFFNPTGIIIAAVIIVLVMAAGLMEIVTVLSVIVYIILEILLTIFKYEYIDLPSYKYATLVVRIIVWGISINRFFAQIVKYYNENSLGGLIVGGLVMLFGVYAWLLILSIYYEIELKYLESKSYNGIIDVALSLIIPIIVRITMVNAVHSLLF